MAAEILYTRHYKAVPASDKYILFNRDGTVACKSPFSRENVRGALEAMEKAFCSGVEKAKELLVSGSIDALHDEISDGSGVTTSA